MSAQSQDIPAPPQDEGSSPAIHRGTDFTDTPTPANPTHTSTGTPSKNFPITAGPSDEQLLARSRAGDASALSDLLTRYQDRLYGLCFRMVNHHEMAADLTQECMVRLIQGFPGFDGKSLLSTWITRVALNVCFSKLRSEKLRRHASLDAPASGHGARAVGGFSGAAGAPGASGSWNSPAASGSGVFTGARSGSAPSSDGHSDAPPFWSAIEDPREPRVMNRVQFHDDRDRLRAALTLLDAETRAILVLRDGRGLDYDQIAEVFGIAVGTVKSRLFRARATLRDFVERIERGDPVVLGALAARPE